MQLSKKNETYEKKKQNKNSFVAQFTNISFLIFVFACELEVRTVNKNESVSGQLWSPLQTDQAPTRGQFLECSLEAGCRNP